MSSIDKNKTLIVISCSLLIIVIIILSYFYLRKQYVETLPQFVNKAQLVSSVDEEKEETTKEEIPQIKVDNEITIYNSSEEIIYLNTHDWYFPEVYFDGECIIDGLKYYYDTFSIEREGNIISRIIFNKNYKTDIVSGITVGMDINVAKNILGKSVFENEDYNMIGYKTQKLYLCLYEDEIAVYRNKYFYNAPIEEMILKYYNKEFEGSRNDFSKYIINTYEDFKFTADEERNIYLTSFARGIIIKIGENDNDISVEYYKEYDNANVLTKSISEKVVIIDNYLLELMEIERNLKK